MDAFSLGQFLRNAREANEIELADAVAKLRIRQPILEAFEAGDFAATNMSDIQIRGMLRNYARFLALDEEQVLRFYDEARFGKQGRGRWGLRRQSRPRAGGSPSRDAQLPMQEIDYEQSRAQRRRRLWRTFWLLVFSAAAIVIIAFVTRELIDTDLAGENLDDAPLASESEVAPSATARPPPTSTATVLSPTPSNRAVYRGSGILVSILARQRSWIRILIDGQERYAGIAAPDTLLEFDALTQISLTASNAMALDIIWNGQPQERIGGRGQRVDMVFSATEVNYSLGPGAAPTPLSPTSPATADAALTIAALTPTETPGPSPTSTMTLAPSETLTVTPSPTYTPSMTATASQTPTATETPTITLTPTETAILPPRMTQAGIAADQGGSVR